MGIVSVGLFHFPHSFSLLLLTIPPIAPFRVCGEGMLFLCPCLSTVNYGPFLSDRFLPNPFRRISCVVFFESNAFFFFLFFFVGYLFFFPPVRVPSLGLFHHIGYGLVYGTRFLDFWAVSRNVPPHYQYPGCAYLFSP